MMLREQRSVASGEQQTMRAIAQERYGSAGVLALVQRPTPTVGKGQVLVRVHAAGVDPAMWHFMTGLPYLVRLGVGLRAPRIPVVGVELAGVVAAVGPGVTDFAPGDEVYGTCRGSFADYAVARADRIAKKPPSRSFIEAAAMPNSGLTALHALRAARLVAGQRVLIIGAGGGVGTYAVQLAKHLGAHVTAVCSTGKIDLVRSLGADATIDYTRDALAGTYDAIIDAAGNRPLRVLRRHLTRRGALVIVGGEGGGRWFGGLGRTFMAPLLSLVSRQRLVGLISLQSRADLEQLTALVEAGAFRPAVDRVYPLAEAPAAVHALEARAVRGKLVIALA